MTVAECEWLAAAPGLKPLRLPRAQMPVPYSPPSVGAYTRTPSHNHYCSAIGAQIISLRSDDLVVPRGGRQTKDCSQTLSFGFQFCLVFRWTWTAILLPENWVSWISPNTWRDTVFKWTHRLLKEGNNLERSLICACGGCYPRISGRGSELIQKVPMMERLPRGFNIVEHW